MNQRPLTLRYWKPFKSDLSALSTDLTPNLFFFFLNTAFYKEKYFWKFLTDFVDTYQDGNFCCNCCKKDIAKSFLNKYWYLKNGPVGLYKLSGENLELVLPATRSKILKKCSPPAKTNYIFC